MNLHTIMFFFFSYFGWGMAPQIILIEELSHLIFDFKVKMKITTAVLGKLKKHIVIIVIILKAISIHMGLT